MIDRWIRSIIHLLGVLATLVAAIVFAVPAAGQEEPPSRPTFPSQPPSTTTTTAQPSTTTTTARSSTTTTTSAPTTTATTAQSSNTTAPPRTTSSPEASSATTAPEQTPTASSAGGNQGGRTQQQVGPRAQPTPGAEALAPNLGSPPSPPAEVIQLVDEAAGTAVELEPLPEAPGPAAGGVGPAAAMLGALVALALIAWALSRRPMRTALRSRRGR